MNLTKALNRGINQKPLLPEDQCDSPKTYAIFDIETTGLNPQADEIICIGYKLHNERTGEGPTRTFINTTLLQDTQSQNKSTLIALEFLNSLEMDKVDVLVGFNTKNFDLPFILAKLEPPDINRLLSFKSIDLRLILNPNKYARGKLKDYLLSYGIPNNDEYSGLHVPQLLQEGNTEAILSHLMHDLSSTYELFKRVYLEGDIRPPLFL